MLWIPKCLNNIATDTLLMESTTFDNVSEVLKRTVKNDGRVGGLQSYCGKTVDVVIYNEEEEGN